MLPWMWGRATLAMVVSTACMIVASMVDTVIMARLSAGAGVAVAAAALISGGSADLRRSGARVEPRQHCARPFRHGALALRVDLNGRAHPGAQDRIVISRLNR